MTDKTKITIALSKGRIFKDTLPLLKAAGIVPKDNPETCRKLYLDTNLAHVKLLVIRATDVPVYVQYGAADIGVAGKDVLLETKLDDLYEPLDLKIAKCKMMTARIVDQELPTGKIKVATKYPNITKQFFAARGQQAEVIKLYGAMELAPLVGLADCIVDLVETGNTLKANNLEPVDTIANISSRLIVNKAAMKIKSTTIKNLIAQISQAIK